MTNALELSNKFKIFVEKHQQKIVEAAGADLNPDRLQRMMLLSVNKPDKKGAYPLLECSQASLFGAMLECCCYGLYPSVAGHVYIVPYAKKAQFMLGYKGMVQLAYRSDRVVNVDANVIDTADQYKYIKGTREELIHEPSFNPNGTIIAAYCVVSMRGTDKTHLQLVPKVKIEEARGRSKLTGLSFSPWNSDYNAMAKKTAMRRCFPWIPMSVEVQNIVAADEAGERGDQRHTVYEGVVMDDDSPEGEEARKEAKTRKNLGSKLRPKEPVDTRTQDDKDADAIYPAENTPVSSE